MSFFVLSFVSVLLIPATASTQHGESSRYTRCTKSECDSSGALSYCGPIEKPCNPNHEDAPASSCIEPNKRCCRSICNGPMSHCLHNSRACLPGYEEAEGKCLVDGHKCCKPIS
ncbi:uncharacterized protein LOC105851040 [Hydra vulgaris]|uniref:uncharacterized protein LOC105851040 n=1 Tax=Hydra vulgaris TaxID=6087 RepID=UPI000640E462|nr:uncharacterized protein LOC105851040 [Hydra vulgaris]